MASSVPDADDSHGTHTFKIVTTKRNLLVCAPSEEDEIKWLGAVRALIARRSGTGVVPGESGKSGHSSDVNPSGGTGGIKNKVRRLSASGPTTIPGESAQQAQP